MWVRTCTSHWASRSAAAARSSAGCLPAPLPARVRVQQVGCGPARVPCKAASQWSCSGWGRVSTGRTLAGATPSVLALASTCGPWLQVKLHLARRFRCLGRPGCAWAGSHFPARPQHCQGPSPAADERCTHRLHMDPTEPPPLEGWELVEREDLTEAPAQAPVRSDTNAEEPAEGRTPKASARA